MVNKLFLLLVLIMGSLAWGQNTPTTGVLPDNGPSLPATCIIGQIYFRTATTIGLNQCNPANTWTALVAGSGGLPAHLSYADPTLTVSAATFGNGQVALSGNTSGTATITAPAVAGTATNQITFSNSINIPIGGGTAATPALQMGVSTAGFETVSNNDFEIISNATRTLAVLNFGGNNFASMPNTGIWAWTSGAISAAIDTGISRTGADVIAAGNGTQADESALLRWNTCKVSSDITLTVNTNITVCTWPLPAVAKTWAWQCHIPWVISAGSGTNTISIGVNASQAPTVTTTANATILSTNTGTQTNATVNLSASGALNVLTSPTITPAATVFQSETFGTLAASGTAGTFTITMNAAGTTATALAKAGATCILY